jgi:hypothetical protein
MSNPPNHNDNKVSRADGLFIPLVLPDVATHMIRQTGILRKAWLVLYLIPISIKIISALSLTLSTELRFCDRCMVKTSHKMVENSETIYTYKRRRLYQCKECGHKSYRRGLRPSAESVY